MPDDHDARGTEPTPGGQRRAAWVDAAMTLLAAGPVVSVLLGNGDLFLLTSAALPVGVMLACSFDPLDPADIVARREAAARQDPRRPR